MKKKIVKVPSDIHRDISIKAAISGRTIESLVEEALKKYLKKNGVNLEDAL